MSICLPFLLYVCGFFSKDHAYTSIEDSMAIGDPRVEHKKIILMYHYLVQNQPSAPALIKHIYISEKSIFPNDFSYYYSKTNHYLMYFLW